MIQVENLWVEYRDFSLKEINLTVPSSSCHLLIGPTGCGKTTLLEAILGFKKVSQGSIFLEGKDISHLPVHKRGFSYVPQDLAIFPHLTVEENITYGIKFGKVENKQERIRFAFELAEAFGISHLLKKKASFLSGGERQRVALARALASGQRYLLLDEPFSSLHEGLKRELWLLLKELQKTLGLTILMVSHDLEETFFMADYVTVMIEGKILQSDTKEKVYREPKNIKVASYFGIKNIFNGIIKKIDHKDATIFCEEINKEITLPREKILKISSSQIKFGIREEEIIILRPDLPSKKENLIEGIVEEIYPFGPKTWVRFKPLYSKKAIEIILPDYALNKINLRPSKKITVTLPKEKIFVLEED
ncbi:ABC transporter [Caldimicrobium thiodismutans]|uniref:ABC transporter n=1 Tax=Caldimicrobium thiodismutans TaxID=1653476 RepID=A0A0U4W523_9BACT|nr:ABC transporter ATP-binding protein [Caldimicrobium thiodismutans]BAU24154.1 ABC transporter [Caldimicrobium thiodismutans]